MRKEKMNQKAISGKVVCEVESPGEYKEATAHAEALGMSLQSAEAVGDWETDDGHPVFIKHTVEVEKVGTKYFHISVDGEVIPLQPVDYFRHGALHLTFTV